MNGRLGIMAGLKEALPFKTTFEGREVLLPRDVLQGKSGRKEMLCEVQ